MVGITTTHTAECFWCRREIRSNDPGIDTAVWRHLDGRMSCSNAKGTTTATPRMPEDDRTWFEARTLDGTVMATRAFSEVGVGAARLMTLIENRPYTPADWLVKVQTHYGQPLTLHLQDA